MLMACTIGHDRDRRRHGKMHYKLRMRNDLRQLIAIRQELSASGLENGEPIILVETKTAEGL